MNEISLRVTGFEDIAFFGSDFKTLYENFIDVYKAYYQTDISDRTLFDGLIHKTKSFGIFPLDLQDSTSLYQFYNTTVKSPGLDLSDQDWYEILYMTTNDVFDIDEFGIDPRASQFVICEKVNNEEMEIEPSDFDKDGNYQSKSPDKDKQIEEQRRISK